MIFMRSFSGLGLQYYGFNFQQGSRKKINKESDLKQTTTVDPSRGIDHDSLKTDVTDKAPVVASVND